MKMTHFSRSLAFATALFAGAMTFAAALTAEAAEPNKGQLAAYVWAENPKAAAAYTPSAGYQFNITKAVNSITRTGDGKYAVKLVGVKSAGGHAQVTAYGAGTDFCKVVSWNPAGNDTSVNVACFTHDGKPADTQFALAFFN